MKINLLFLFFPLLLLINVSGSFDRCSKRNEKTYSEDSTILIKLMSIDKNKFINKPVDSLLSNEVFSKFSKYYFIDEPIGYFQYTAFEYHPWVRVNVFVSMYKYFKKEGRMYKDWKLADFKKEIITGLTLTYKGEIVQQIGQ